MTLFHLLQARALVISKKASSIAGIVKGNPLMPFLQWFGRANVLFGVMHHIQEVDLSYRLCNKFELQQSAASKVLRSHHILYLLYSKPAKSYIKCFFQAIQHPPKRLQVQREAQIVSILFGSWAIADVTRYAWYSLAQLNDPPRLLTWLR